jgi:hypothetical protein
MDHSDAMQEVRLVLDTPPWPRARVLMRGRYATCLHFGLMAFPLVEQAWERRGGAHVGGWRSGDGRTSWSGLKIATTERYPGSRRPRTWQVSVTAGLRNRHLVDIAHVIEASGAGWLGFMYPNGAWRLKRETLLATTPSGAAQDLLAAMRGQ